jgi:hypothetical protein
MHEIACSLDAGEMRTRLAGMSALGRSSLLSAKSAGRRAELRFRPEADTADRLTAIVAAEAECCAFLAMDLRSEPDALRLTIEAPEGAEHVLEELVEAFRGGTETVARMDA